MFRGREQSRPELGFRLLQRLADDIQELGFVESSPKQDGRNMIMVVAPHKNAKVVRALARAVARARDRPATPHRVGRQPDAPGASLRGEHFTMPKIKTHSGIASGSR